MNAEQRPLVVIVGPTASGKSALGVALAERLSGEVVVCDSTQLYRGFDIGTAKPTEAERHGIPHHLIGVLSPADESTAGAYRQAALAVLADLRHRRRLPIFTAGTGLYLRALLEGLADVPLRSEPLRERLRAIAAAHRPGHLHRILHRWDPESARKIASTDQQKLIRALEVCMLARKPLSEVYRAGRAPLDGWRILKIGLMPSREVLYDRIRLRTDAMLAGGWLDEVAGLLAAGLDQRKAKPFQFIGYPELRSVLQGHITLDNAREAIQQATRHYAKRQLTWFRRDASIHWFSGLGDDPKLQNQVWHRLQEQGIFGGRCDQSPGV
ncbi:MAG: tRNA (adenosine(37)-N6)-dimethylallyltransferase MiaA [Candidatus Acidiferrum sp.]